MIRVTVFLGVDLRRNIAKAAAIFRALQWMLGLRRLKQDAIDRTSAREGDRVADARCIVNFQRQLRAHGLARRYCLLYQDPASQSRISPPCAASEFPARTTRADWGLIVLLNLAYSIHPPFLLEFERRIFCDLDPSEIFIDDEA
jgi:hypothetical protein